HEPILEEEYEPIHEEEHEPELQLDKSVVSKSSQVQSQIAVILPYL
ncbi:14859_t:CDS:1, partial [Racocetra persica]